MSEIQISASEFMTTRDVDITLMGDDGKEFVHTFTVQKGAGADLDISILSSKLSKAGQELINLRSRLLKTQKDGDEAATEALMGDVNAKMEELGDIQTRLTQRYMRMFNDHEDGSKTALLFDLVGTDGIMKMIERIFANGTSSK